MAIIDRREIIVPVTAPQAVADCPAHIGYDAVGKEVLLAALHLDDEMVATLVGAINVKDDILLKLAVANLFLGQITDFRDNARFGGKGHIQKSNEKFLVVFSTEDSLEAEIRQGMDEIGGLFLCLIHGCKF